MLMRKRLRNLMKRTTSQKSLSLDLSTAASPLQIQQQQPPPLPLNQKRLKRKCSGIPSAADPAPFLMSCCLCKRSLGPGFDTFMYRGEVAFCSNECREKQIAIDEKDARKKCSSSIVKKADHPPPLKRSGSSTSSETIAAA